MLRIFLSDTELQGLKWCAERYSSAEFLYNNVEMVGDGWPYLTLGTDDFDTLIWLSRDDGANGMTIPCWGASDRVFQLCLERLV